MERRERSIPPTYALLGAFLLSTIALLLLEYEVLPVTGVYGPILLLLLALIATGAMDKTITVMIGSGVCLFLATAGGHLGGVHGGELPAYVHMVEWSAVGIIIGATIFVELASHSGVFSYISIILLKVSRGRPIWLLVFFAALTLLFSAFLDNVTAMIIVGSLTIIASDKLDLNPIPFVVTEALMTNVGGTMTLISSIPNIIIGTRAGLSYLTILYMLTPYALVSMSASLAVTVWMFSSTFRQHQSDEELEEQSRRARQFDAWETVDDMGFFYVSIFCVLAFIAAFALHGVIPVIQKLPLEWIALGFGTIMLVIFPADVEDTLENIEWNLIFFFIGLFTIIGVMKEVGVLKQVGLAMKPYLASGPYSGPSFLMWFAAGASGLTNNIPLAAMLVEIVDGLQLDLAGDPFWWALILGTNLGGNLTSIGSVSTMVGVTVLRQEGIPISFLEFAKMSLSFVVVQILLANLYLAIIVAL